MRATDAYSSIWSGAAPSTWIVPRTIILVFSYKPWPCLTAWLEWKFTPPCVSVFLANRSPPNLWTSIVSPPMHGDYVSEITPWTEELIIASEMSDVVAASCWSGQRIHDYDNSPSRLFIQEIHKAISRIVAVQQNPKAQRMRARPRHVPCRMSIHIVTPGLRLFNLSSEKKKYYISFTQELKWRIRVTKKRRKAVWQHFKTSLPKRYLSRS